MGERSSVQFGMHQPDGSIWLSAVLKDHWGGPELGTIAAKFADSIDRGDGMEIGKGLIMHTPLGRLEPDAVMVAFVQSFKNSQSLRLVPTRYDCDNSDWGHFIVWLDKRQSYIENL